MDKAYENNKTIALTKAHNFHAVVLPKKIVNPLGYRLYDKQLYKQRNIIERYFLRLKRFRKVLLVVTNLILFLFLLYLSFLFSIRFLCYFNSLFLFIPFRVDSA